jgi:hypothetical protein
MDDFYGKAELPDQVFQGAYGSGSEIGEPVSQ